LRGATRHDRTPPRFLAALQAEAASAQDDGVMLLPVPVVRAWLIWTEHLRLLLAPARTP
jgi:hypothetical protein